MRMFVIYLLLGGCSAAVPQSCPPLPVLAADEDPVRYATTLAGLYARCAEGRR